MHFCPCVVQRRDAEEHVVPCLAVVVLLRLAGADQGEVVVQDRLGKAGGAGGKVDGRMVRLLQGYRRRVRGAEAHQLPAVLRIGRLVPAHEKHHPHLGQLVRNGVHPADKLRPEHQGLHVRQLQAVLDLVAGVPEIHRHGDTARLEDAEVHRQPLQAVHHQDGHLGPPPGVPAEQEVGKLVGPPVELLPAHSPPVGGVGPGALDEAGLPPGDGLVPLLRGAQLHQRRLRAVEPGVSLQKICNDHR